jgi:hypothetical protein
MTDVPSTVSRGQFLRNTAKGGIVLATSGGVLASLSGVALLVAWMQVSGRRSAGDPAFARKAAR